MLHTVKLYHWRTHSYSEHKATDNLHEALSEQESILRGAADQLYRSQITAEVDAEFDSIETLYGLGYRFRER